MNLEESLEISLDSPMQCFRCFDMKVVDPVVLGSIKSILAEAYEVIEKTHTRGAVIIHSGLDKATGEIDKEWRLISSDDILERINNHIILLETMPDE